MATPRLLQTRAADGSGSVSTAPYGPGTSSFTDMGGLVLPAMNVQLVFWGAAWADGAASGWAGEVAGRRGPDALGDRFAIRDLQPLPVWPKP